jgi:hypothetical protein
MLAHSLPPHQGLTLADVATDLILETAYAWLCQQRRDWPVEADVWRFRQRWPEEKARIREELLTGTYAITLLRRVTLQNGEEVDLWAARDAVVMKALALVLPHYLPLSPRCTHLKGHGGLKYAVREVVKALPQHHFVLKTDVQAYYASIDHQLLLDHLAVRITDRHVLNLIGQYLRRCAERGGLYWDHKKGIALGSPLSPILGAFFLTEVDDAMGQLGLFYVRYMDDLLVLTPTRWKLHQAVKVVNQALTARRLTKHPEKTFIGKIAKGFDFLGYHFSPDGLRVATKTLANFVARMRQLYEHKQRERVPTLLGAYVRRWVQWVRAGLSTSPQLLLPGLMGADP